MALFENYEGRMPQLQPVLDKYGFKTFDDVKAFTNGKGVTRTASWKARSPSASRTSSGLMSSAPPSP